MNLANLKIKKTPKGIAKRGVMNKTEAAFDQQLKFRMHAGEILWYNFEGISFRLAKGAKYTPDFIVMKDNYEIEIYEVKGFFRTADRLRLKIAADMYPFKFIAAIKDKTGWKFEEMN